MNLREILSELDGMVDWFLLGVYLGVPVGKLKDVEEAYPKPSRRRAEMIIVWSKQEEPSWQKLVTAQGWAGVSKCRATIGFGESHRYLAFQSLSSVFCLLEGACDVSLGGEIDDTVTLVSLAL